MADDQTIQFSDRIHGRLGCASKDRSELDHAVTAAEKQLEALERIEDAHTQDIKGVRQLRANVEEVAGILAGIKDRRITSGQARLSILLNQIIQNWPETEVPNELFHILGDCASFGLSVEGQHMGTYTGRGHPRT